MTSLEVLWWVRSHGSAVGIRAPDRLVMIMLVAFWEPGGRLRPSVGQLQRATGLGRTAVQRALRRLAQAGLVRIRAGGGRAPNSYELTIPAAHETSSSRRDPVAQDTAPAHNAGASSSLHEHSEDLSLRISTEGQRGDASATRTAGQVKKDERRERDQGRTLSAARRSLRTRPNPGVQPVPEDAPWAQDGEGK